MTLNQLIYFEAVARHQHFRLAAAELSVSQPNLSRSISNLEDELGILLFERKGRNVMLTKYGKIFLEHTERILADVRLAEKQMKSLTETSGRVDIAYVFPLALHYIPRMVRRFLEDEKNKDVSFNFHQSSTPEMIEGLKTEQYDVVFGSYAENEPDIRFLPIIRQEMIIITPKGHPLTEKSSVMLKDLEQYPVIGYDSASGLGRFTQRIYESYDLRPEIICNSPDENAIASLVAEDFGIALVADVESLEHFSVEKISISGTDLFHTVYLAYLKSHYQIPAVRNFISFIEREGIFL